MTQTEFEFLEKQKQVYFVTQRIEGAKGFINMAYGLTIDCLLDNKNNFVTLAMISKEIDKKNIIISPEELYDSLAQLKVGEIFENFPSDSNSLSPFRLRDKIYQDFISTTDYIQQLRSYVERFLTNVCASLSFKDKLIEILLESIFYCNIKFLKHIVSAKEETSLSELLRNSEASQVSEKQAYILFNDLLQSSTSEFDEILRGLILRMFDFLSLNFNPKYSAKIERVFGGKFYYLDSSFIIRLLGFDGEIRRCRALDLIAALKQIKEVRFVVHEKSIEESKIRIKELIGRSSSLLTHDSNVITSILSHDENGNRSNHVFSIYKECLEKGAVRSYNDFCIYCENVKQRIRSILPNLEFDNGKLPNKLSQEREAVIRELRNNTDKSHYRIKFITSLLDYIDSKRGANNYDIADIKYWLITTDKKTLSYDNNLPESVENSSCYSLKKSICIMPSELIRLLDGFSGNIRSNHVGVFKNYMLKSHVLPHPYDENEIKTICTIATLVEKTNMENFDIDEMVDRVLHDTSISILQKRLDRLKLQRERDQEIINHFIERTDDILGVKFTKLISNARNKADKEANRNWSIISWAISIVALIIILVSSLNFDKFQWNDISTYFKLETWTIIEIFLFFSGSILGKLSHFFERCKERYVGYYISKEVEAITSNLS